MRAVNAVAGAVLSFGLLVQATRQPLQNWGKYSLKGWWNPNGGGQRPTTVLYDYDYIVVGSGPGGAPLAARLGLAGHKVLVIEAGADEAPDDWNITAPVLNTKASEDPKISWSFLVNHYPDLARSAKDPKYYFELANGSLARGYSDISAVPAGATPKGAFYPRSAAIGGCANHNALIMIYPLDDDWTQIVNLTGDDSWNAANMRTYFEKVEDCQYLAPGTPGHGFGGWLPTNRAEESIFLNDSKVYPMLKAAASLSGQVVESVDDLTTLLRRDINSASPLYASEQGIYNTPLNMDRYKRSSPRDFLVETAQALSGNARGGKIDIRTNCLATRVIFVPGTTRAIGVEFLDGASLYRADPRAAANGTDGTTGVAFARSEVIVAGGAYNTPQLLKLSGVGPAAELEQFSIPCVANLAGVGSNLQDRYENSVIANLSEPFTIWKGCTLGANSSDPCLQQWESMQSNMSKYSTNGRPVTIPKRSTVALNANNDLIISSRPGYFGGYFFGYSTIGSKFPNSWTWPVLKAHSQNRAGTVTLRSADPRDTPEINFNYFDSGSGDWEYDLDAVVEALEFSRSIFAAYAQATNSTISEIAPGPQYQTSDDLKEWARYTSWGHHASCSCPIGADGDPMAVLDSNFRVRGTTGLRVVDASVFPHIPGFYIQTPIYQISEKAADVINAASKTLKQNNFASLQNGHASS